jgi:Regulator of ribonuclease activity B
MSAPSDFPTDENGNILRQLHEQGDALDQPRNVNFAFAFPQRQQAIAFAELVDEPEFDISISRYEERDMWQAVVTRHMLPTHSEITALEHDLGSRAESVGGERDGWGCFVVKSGDRPNQTPQPIAGRRTASRYDS